MFKKVSQMKVVQINAVCNGSTGKICVAISDLLTQEGIENYIFHTGGKVDLPAARQYMTHNEIKLQALRSRILGNYGFNSAAATRRLLKQLDAFSPDIVHLHNIHGHNCHLGMLLTYLKEKKIRVVWTFHDCWTFTGYCTYFDIVCCTQWKEGCQKCPQRKKYSWFFDRSCQQFANKKVLMSGLDLTIVAPSNWIKRTAQESFFRDVPMHVIHNGIDLEQFQPTAGDFRERYGCKDKYIVLGVAFSWGERKGLDVFIQLSQMLDNRYQIVLVGTDEAAEQQLPENIISIRRTKDQKELAELYTAANVFANPTREEVLGLVNVEALACGTPVITFDTGGSPECVDESCGRVVPKNDVTAMYQQIVDICENAPFTKDACMEKAKYFDQRERFAQYVALYMTLRS